MLSTRQSLRSVPGIIALTLAAGTALPALADTRPQPDLSVSSTKAGGSLTLNGTTFRSTAARVANQRLFTFTNSSKVLVVWDEFTGGVKTSWFALSLDGARVDQVASTANFVRTDFAQFDPLVATPAIPAALEAGPENELFFVQFVATPLDEMRRDIVALGGVVERFLTDNTHIVRMTAEARAGIAALPYVRWVGAYHPAYRVNPELRSTLMAGASAEAIGERYSIECMRRGPAQQTEIADLVTGLGGIVDFTIPDQFRLEATLTPAQLQAVVQRNEISFVDNSGAPYGQDMDIVRATGGANPFLSGLNFKGQGVRGEVFDSGVITNHQQWDGQLPLVRTTNTNNSHGNACYGINFATGVGNAQATGLLPMREQGIISRYQDTNQGGLGTGTNTRLALNTAAVNPAGNVRSCFQTSSVGSPRVTTYTTVSAEVDDYLLRADYLSFQSQSNAANTRDSRPQAWAKNMISIGAIDLLETANPADDIHVNASVGPADDLRVKPDLSYAYLNVFTTSTTSATGYGQFSGTSSATPCTSGHGGLLLQMWHEGVWTGFGGGSSVFDSRPKSTTAKAMLINTAYRNTPNATNRLYRAFIGWGRADVANLYNTRAKTFIVNETEVLTNAQSKTYTLNVAAGEPEFRATMIFADPQGVPTAAQDRINDLTLKVTAPGGAVYWGNNGMIGTTISGAGQIVGDNWTAPGGAANTVDTVENVFIQNPAAGSWTVEVIATQIVQDARLETPATDADFALVVGGVTSAPVVCYANCDGSAITPILNVNDFVCFNNRFVAGDSWANCDQSTAVPVLNVADYSCFINVFAAGCP